METDYSELFNNGDNDGDLVIISKEKESIRCHLDVVKKGADYFKGLDSYQNNSGGVSVKQIFMDYPIDHIKLLINYLYNPVGSLYCESGIDYENFSIEELLDLYKMVDELIVVVNRDSIENELVSSFSNLLNEQNWKSTLEYIYKFDVYDDFTKKVFEFYFNLIQKKGVLLDTLISDIDLSSHFGRFFYKNLMDRFRKILFQHENIKNKLEELLFRKKNDSENKV